MRICIAGSFDPEFHRNVRLRQLLEKSGHEVTLRTVRIWGDDRVRQATTGRWHPVLRAVTGYPSLAVRMLSDRKPDLVLVAYPGWFDMLVVAPLCRLRGVPVVLDMFISLYDTLVSDRALVGPSSLTGRLARWIDRLSCRLATRVLADTPVHGDFFSRLAGIDRERIGVVWLGAREDVFYPREVAVEQRRVFFHGTFVPLQGLETIVRAAHLLEGEEVEFVLAGEGQESERVDQLIRDLGIASLRRVGQLDLGDVPLEIARSALTLGVFGTSSKAQRVVPNKVYECLAVGRPVITADTPAIRSAFRADELALAPAGDPPGLADQIRRLLADKAAREELAEKGHQAYLSRFSESELAHGLDRELTIARSARAIA